MTGPPESRRNAWQRSSPSAVQAQRLFGIAGARGNSRPVAFWRGVHNRLHATAQLSIRARHAIAGREDGESMRCEDAALRAIGYGIVCRHKGRVRRTLEPAAIRKNARRRFSNAFGNRGLPSASRPGIAAESQSTLLAKLLHDVGYFHISPTRAAATRCVLKELASTLGRTR